MANIHSWSIKEKQIIFLNQEDQILFSMHIIQSEIAGARMDHIFQAIQSRYLTLR